MNQKYRLTITVDSLAAAAHIEGVALDNGAVFEIEKVHANIPESTFRGRKHTRVTTQGIAHVKNTIKQYPNASDKQIVEKCGLGYSAATINRIRNDKYDSLGRPKVDRKGQPRNLG